ITEAAMAMGGMNRAAPTRVDDLVDSDGAPAPPRAASSTALAPRGSPRSANCSSLRRSSSPSGVCSSVISLLLLFLQQMQLQLLAGPRRPGARRFLGDT